MFKIAILLTLRKYLFVKNKARSLDYCSCLHVKNNKSKVEVELTKVCLIFPLSVAKFNVRAKIQIFVDKDTVNVYWTLNSLYCQCTVEFKFTLQIDTDENSIYSIWG